MKSYIVLFGALFALACVVSADVAGIDGAQPASEAPVQKIHVLNPGEREYLSPNLIGVQNIAVTNIPLTMNFINIIDAHREVVDGVRYEIVLNAVNTTDNNTEVVCRLVVLEKPWLTTLWGDKVRLLQESNCTNEELPESPRDRKTLEEKYETNTLFTGTRNELTADDMVNLESQILTSSNPQMTRQRKTATTTELTEVVQPEQVTISEVVTDSSPSTNTEEKALDTTADEPIVLSSEGESTTTEKITPLSDDEKKWLDDFLSVGAFNFETLQQQKRASSANDETQLGDQQQQEEASQRQRRSPPVLGGARDLSPKELEEEEGYLATSLTKLASGDGPHYKIAKVYSGTTQVVSGSLTKLDCDLIDENSGKTERCLVSIWAQSWLKKDGYELTFECNGKEKEVHRHSRSVEAGAPGAPGELNPEELKEEEGYLAASLTKLASGDGPSYTIAKVYSGTKQVVSGSLTKLDCDLINEKSGETERCLVSLWSQPWLEKDGYEVTFECKDKEKEVHRHSRSVEPTKAKGAPRELKPEELKEEEGYLAASLTKLASGDGPSYTIAKVYSGTKQVVSGSLTKLDCDLINEKSGETERCLVSLWSQPWLEKDGYEVTFECKDKEKEVRRHSRSVERRRRAGLGGPKNLSPEELKKEEANLAASLTKLASGDGPSYKIGKVYSGTTQVVSGSLTKLDCDLIDENSGETQRCLVSLWSQPWLEKDGYEVTFECKDKEKEVHRHSRSVNEIRPKPGGSRQLNANELKAEEAKVSASLAKIASGDGPSYSISKVFSGTKQIVAGTLVKIDAELIDGSNGAKERCLISLWSRPWVKVDGYEVTFECENKEKVVQRHSRSVEHAQKKGHKKNHRLLDKAEHLFQKFQTRYQKQYHNTMERQMRLRIFKHNLKLIQDLNKHEMGSAKYGITEFADMTTTEYRERTGLMSREDSNAVRSQAAIPDVELPKEFDWRDLGVISQVKNQGSCGSCWAFSVTGNIEGLHAVKTGHLEEYSEQELLDCDTIDSACQGGLPDNAYQAIEKIGGLELESDYPYVAKKSKCHFNQTLTRVRISGAVDLPKNETAMAQWLISNGPISIGINANAMQFYRGGVSHPWKLLCSKNNLDHGVLIVGYGVSDYPMFKKTIPYWIIKNSWGAKWGEQGYYRVYRGDNTCGVSEMATSAILA